MRGKDLIWNYVLNNYLMGNDPPPFDLLHCEGDLPTFRANGTATISIGFTPEFEMKPAGSK